MVTEDWYFWSHRRALALAAMQQGFKVTVVTRLGRYKEKIRNLGIDSVDFSMHRSLGNPFSELRTLLRLIKIYKKLGPDLVHHIALKPAIIGSLAARLAKVPAVVNSYTGLGYLFTTGSFLSTLFSWFFAPLISLLPGHKRIYSIVQNPDDLNLLIKRKLVRHAHTVMIRGSGVDTGKFSMTTEPPGNEVIVLFASRFLKDKGVFEFIEAARILARTCVKARFVMAGDLDEGNPTSITSKQLQAWINEGIIQWWGYRDDMEMVFSQAHIVCLPSYREGLPRVLLEAASSGRPIVTTDAPGCREVVIDGINGYLVPVRDSIRLAEAIRQLVESSDLRMQMGVAGRDRVVNNFGAEADNSATLAFYSNILVHQTDHFS